jgi:imidazoleglycerol phosphate dehydratase HisB
MRIKEIERKTKETYIKFKINLDGKGEYTFDTQIPFLNIC